MYWERDGRGLGAHRDGRDRRPSTRRVPSSTSPGTRPRPSPAGPASACRPSSSGRRRRRGWRASAAPGSGPPPTSSPTPASTPSPTRSTRRSSSATTYKVLRGASWATHPHVARPSFRNWDLPQRRQIFAGIRLASDPKGTLDDDRDRRPPARRPGRGDGARRARGPGADAEGALAEVLLRRARLAALRGDHRAGGVLPDPPRAPDPGRALGRDRRRRGQPGDADRARLRLGLEDPPPARRDARRGQPAHLRPGRHLRGDHPRNRRGAGRGVPRARRPRAGLRLRGAPRAHADDERGRAAPDRLPRRHDRQPLPGRAGRLPRPHRRPPRPRRPPAARHRPGQGRRPPGARLRRPGRGHRRIQQERPLRAEPRAGRGLRPRRLRPRRRASTPSTSGSTSACARWSTRTFTSRRST